MNTFVTVSRSYQSLQLSMWILVRRHNHPITHDYTQFQRCNYAIINEFNYKLSWLHYYVFTTHEYCSSCNADTCAPYENSKATCSQPASGACNLEYSLFAKTVCTIQFYFLHWSWLQLYILYRSLQAGIQLIMFLFYRPWAYSSALPNEPWVWTSGGAASNWPESPVWFRLSADCSPANRTHCVAGKILYLDGQIIWIIHDTGYYKYSEHSMVALLPAYFKNGLIQGSGQR